MRSLAAAAAFLLMLTDPVFAQWARRPDPVLRSGRDGKFDLSARPPKRDGKPDLSGVWHPVPDPEGKPEGVENAIFPRYFVNIAQDLKPEEVPFQPWAEARFKEHLQSMGKADPIARCQPSGVPAIGTIPLPYKIVQTPKLILILHEENTDFRQIFLDGRTLPKDAEPRWMGYSVGRWEGNTLVVETTGFNDRSWLDRMGHPHSDALHVIERFRRPDVGHLEVEVTIDDPNAYTKPITYTQRQILVPDEDLLEYFCTENEKDLARFQ